MCLSLNSFLSQKKNQGRIFGVSFGARCDKSSETHSYISQRIPLSNFPFSDVLKSKKLEFPPFFVSHFPALLVQKSCGKPGADPL